MAKDPAFLFYSKDFYEGTRMMLPEERACYIDLLIYQHQNGGFIPNDLRRLRMYCSGVDEATLEATLKAKFKLCDKGWFNQRLSKTVEERENFSKKQSVNGIVGQFWKKANASLNKNDVKKLKSLVADLTSDNLDFLKNWLDKIKEPKAMLEAMLKHLANVDVIVNVDLEEEKGKEVLGEKPEINIPFDSKVFETQWQLWKVYRKKQHKFSYANIDSENRILTELKNLSNNNEKHAIAIIQQSIDNGWKGFFELKNPRKTSSSGAGISKLSQNLESLKQVKEFRKSQRNGTS